MGILNSDHKLLQPMIYEDKANTNVMLAYFEYLIPKLTTKSVIIMNNSYYYG
jgi:hypothetical protein